MAEARVEYVRYVRIGYRRVRELVYGMAENLRHLEELKNLFMRIITILRSCNTRLSIIYNLLPEDPMAIKTILEALPYETFDFCFRRYEAISSHTNTLYNLVKELYINFSPMTLQYMLQAIVSSQEIPIPVHILNRERENRIIFASEGERYMYENVDAVVGWSEGIPYMEGLVRTIEICARRVELAHRLILSLTPLIRMLSKFASSILESAMETRRRLRMRMLAELQMRLRAGLITEEEYRREAERIRRITAYFPCPEPAIRSIETLVSYVPEIRLRTERLLDLVVMLHRRIETMYEYVRELSS